MAIYNATRLNNDVHEAHNVRGICHMEEEGEKRNTTSACSLCSDIRLFTTLECPNKKYIKKERLRFDK